MSVEVYLVDPPWPKRKGGIRRVRPRQKREMGYKTMPVSEIFQLLDSQILCDAPENHVVFVWTIDSYLHEAEAQMIQRGYRLHARLVWDKTNGVAPAFTVRFSHEYLLWFYKGKFMPISETTRGVYTSCFREASREHSRKPEHVYKMLTDMFPKAEKMDVFSRQRRDGWKQFGDQSEFFAPQI